MADISDAMSLVTTTPVEAAQNIKDAAIVDISPDSYAQNKADFKPAVDSTRRPSEATETVSKVITTSAQHAAVFQDKEDVETFSWFERYADHFGNQLFDIPTTRRRSNELALKRMNNPAAFTEDDLVEWHLLDAEMKQIQDDETRNGFTGDFESLPAKVVGVGADMVRGIYENKETVAKFTATGAAAGGAYGAAVAAPALGIGALAGGLAGAGVGARMGFQTGIAAATFYDTYNQSAAAIYSDLTFGTDDNGQPYQIDENDKVNLARGVGLLSGSIDSLLTLTVAKAIPQLSKYLKPNLRNILAKGGSTAYRQALINIGAAMGVGGSTEVTQEMVQIMGEELGRSAELSEDGQQTELSVRNAVMRISDTIDAYNALPPEEKAVTPHPYLNRLGEAALVGGVAGGSFVAPFQVLGIKELERQVAERNAMFEAEEKTGIPVALQPTPEAAPEPVVTSTDGGGMAIAPEAPVVPQALQADLVPDKPGEAPKTPEQRAVRSARFKEMLGTASAVVKSTGAYKAAKEQAVMLQTEIFLKAGIADMWLDTTQARVFAADPEKAAAVVGMVDPSGASTMAMNADVKVPVGQALKVLDDHPDLIDAMKYAPEDPSPASAINFINQRNEADQRRQEILKSRGEQGADLETINTLDQALNTEDVVTTQVFDEASYQNQPIFTDLIADHLPEGTRRQIRDAQVRTRQQIVDGIAEASKYEMNKVADEVFDAAMEAEFEMQVERFETNPNIDIVELFSSGGLGRPAGFERSRPWESDTLRTELVGPHHKDGFSPIAIDPRLVPEELQPYLTDKRMKRNKVFVKGGISPDEAARMAGVDTPKQLFQILSTTHNRRDAANASTAARRARLREQADESVTPNETAITKAYSANTANHLEEMKIMRSKEWPGLKAGFKTIALHLPTMTELNQRARRAVRTLKVRDLSVNQFVMGERRSQKKAVDAILKNQVEKAYIAKENAALNSEFTKETRLAIGRVNKVRKLVRKFKTPTMRRKLSDAGVLYENAANELLSLFGFNSKPVDPDSLKYFEKLAKESIANGDGDLRIPEGMFTPGMDPKDLTVEQYEIIGEMLRRIDKFAGMKNRLGSKLRKAEETRSTDATSELLHREAVKHPDYDPKKIVTGQGDIKWHKNIGRWLSILESMITSMEHQLSRMDNGKTGGLYNQVIFQPLQAALNQRDRDTGELSKFFAAGIEEYGKKEWKAMGRTAIQVPELSGVLEMRNGDLTKADLFMMAVNLGNGGNIEALENNKISREKAFAIAAKYLTQKDLDFIQTRIWDVYEQYFPRVQELHARNAREKVEMVEAESFEMFGKTYRGGYFPLHYAQGENAGLAQMLESIRYDDDMNAEELRNTYFTTAMTRQGHLITRAGSKAPVSLDMMNISRSFNQVLTDLNMREPVRDAMNLLKHPVIAADIMAVVGKDNYSVMTNTVIDVANFASLNDSPLFGIQQKAFQRFAGGLASVMSNVMLVANMSSILIQPTSSFIAWERMGGRKGGKHLVKTLAMAARSPRHMVEMMRFAAEIDPRIQSTLEDVGDNGAQAIAKLLPVKGTLFGAKGAKRIRYPVAVKEYVNEKGYAALSAVDMVQRSMVTLAAYSQFMAGEAQGWTKAEIDAMDIAERVERAKGYASSMSRLTLTSGSPLDRAPFQKDPSTNMWVRFWNDLRNVLNNTIRQGRMTKNAIRKGSREGYVEAGNILVNFFAISVMMKMYVGWVRDDDDENPIKDLDLTTADGLTQAAENMMTMTMNSPIYAIERIPESTPILRDMWYGMKKKGRDDTKSVTIPVTSVLGDIATAGAGTGALLSNAAELLGIIDSADEISEQQIRAMLKTTGYALGIPINAGIKGWNKWKEVEDDWDAFGARITAPSSTGVQEFNEVAERLKKRPDLPAPLREDIDAIQQMINPIEQGIESAIDPTVYPIIAQIESGGDWTAKNPKSTAAGLYQFLEGTWEEIMEQAPELGLTEGGRVSKNTEQQELAMQWYTKRNATMLAEKNLPVDVETIYTAHFLGPNAGIAVLEAKGERRLRSIVSKEVMTANGFSETMSVKEFKAWVAAKVAKGEEAILNQGEGN